MELRLRCCCAAEFSVIDQRGVYAKGGERDEMGRKYHIEVMADRWRLDHTMCRPPAVNTGLQLPVLAPGPVTC